MGLIMNSKLGVALLAIGLIASLGIAASVTCINLHTIDKNGQGIDGVRVYLESLSNGVGETNQYGYLMIPLNITNSSLNVPEHNTDNIWNITVSKGTKAGYAMVEVPPGTCQNVTISMIY